MSAASTVHSWAATTRWTIAAGSGGQRDDVAAADAVAVDDAHALDHDVGREVGDLARVREVEREPRPACP